MVKKTILLTLSLIISLICLSPVSALEYYVPESFHYTFKEVKEVLDDYFDENNLSFQEGTSEYYTYLLEQLMFHSDQGLKSHPKYEIILDYASEYLFLYQNEEFMNDIKEVSLDETYSTEDFTVDLSKFSNKTIGEISRNIQKEEQLHIENYSNILPMSYSTLNVSKEIAYARQYAKSFNPKYKSYDSDCTNFASQCLVAGGLKMVKKDAIPEYLTLETTSQWYHENIYGTFFVSTSFIRVSDFYAYWQYKSGAVSHSSKGDCAARMQPGDMVILGRPSTKVKYHTIVITKGGSDGTFCAHTNPRLDEKFSNIDSSNYFTRLTFATGK